MERVSEELAGKLEANIQNYGSTKPHILCLDANNLYGWAMSQSLPTAGACASFFPREHPHTKKNIFSHV